MEDIPAEIQKLQRAALEQKVRELELQSQHNKEVADQLMKDFQAACIERDKMELQNDRLKNMLNDIRGLLLCPPADLECQIMRRIEDGEPTEKPQREGLCTNDRDGEQCLKPASHEGICEGPQHVWDWKPTTSRPTTLKKREVSPLIVERSCDKCGHKNTADKMRVLYTVGETTFCGFCLSTTR